jgi:hypothetical protein
MVLNAFHVYGENFKGNREQEKALVASPISTFMGEIWQAETLHHRRSRNVFYFAANKGQ